MGYSLINFSRFKLSSLPILAVSYLYLKGRWSWLPGLSCPIRHLTGIPCPGCFLTRSVSMALNGQLSDSLDLHVLGPPTAVGLVAWSLASLRYKRFYWSKSCQMILILLSILIFVYSQRGLDGLGDMACGLIVIGIFQGAALLFNKIFKKQEN